MTARSSSTALRIIPYLPFLVGLFVAAVTLPSPLAVPWVIWYLLGMGALFLLYTCAWIGLWFGQRWSGGPVLLDLGRVNLSSPLAGKLIVSAVLLPFLLAATWFLMSGWQSAPLEKQLFSVAWVLMLSLGYFWNITLAFTKARATDKGLFSFGYGLRWEQILSHEWDQRGLPAGKWRLGLQYLPRFALFQRSVPRYVEIVVPAKCHERMDEMLSGRVRRHRSLG